MARFPFCYCLRIGPPGTSRRALLGALLILLALSALPRPIPAQGTDMTAAVEEAYRAGRLDDETALVYRVWAALDPQRLPEEFSTKSRRLQKSLTPLLLEVRSRWDGLSLWTRSLLLPYLLRPTEPGQEPFFYGHSYLVPAKVYDSPGGHFRIWYVTSTDDAPELTYSYGDSVPDWIHLCAQVCDHVWEMEVDSLGYRPPPADGSWYGDQDYGGDERYDVYVENLNRHLVYGYTQSEYYVSGQAPRASTSYLVVDDDYAGIYPTAGAEGLMVTAAHEFFHAIQFAYDTLEERFFMEISSTWMEDVVYDDVNDYYYYVNSSGSIFNHPERSLTTFDGIHEYSSCVWNHYLAERHGIGIIRQIWEGCINGTVLSVTDQVLQGRGSSLPAALNEFAVWNAFTGPMADTIAFYPEGQNYPQVRVPVEQIHSQVPVAVDQVAVPPEALGASYVRFEPPADAVGLAVEVAGDPSASWKASLLGAGPPHEVVTVPVDVFGQGQGLLPGWGDDAYGLLVMTPFSTSISAVSYAYQARSDSTIPGPTIYLTVLGQNYPNPVDGDLTVIPFSLATQADVILRIFTLDGQPVRNFDWGRIGPGSFAGPDESKGGWDLTNASGQPVATGIYLYQLQAGDYVETRKMAIVR